MSLVPRVEALALPICISAQPLPIGASGMGADNTKVQLFLQTKERKRNKMTKVYYLDTFIRCLAMRYSIVCIS